MSQNSGKVGPQGAEVQRIIYEASAVVSQEPISAFFASVYGHDPEGSSINVPEKWDRKWIYSEAFFGPTESL